MFLENETQNLQNHKLNIPYDCEFVVIQPKNETTYELTEIFAVKGKSFALDFGTWDKNSGSKIRNVSFYQRRLNLEKTEIKLLSNIEKMVGNK